MEWEFRVRIVVPGRGGRRAAVRATRDVMLKLAAALTKCSLDVDDDDAEAPTSRKQSTTKTRRASFKPKPPAPVEI